MCVRLCNMHQDNYITWSSYVSMPLCTVLHTVYMRVCCVVISDSSSPLCIRGAGSLRDYAGYRHAYLEALRHLVDFFLISAQTQRRKVDEVAPHLT